MIEDSEQYDIQKINNRQYDEFQKLNRIGKICFEVNCDHRSCNNRDYENNDGRYKIGRVFALAFLGLISARIKDCANDKERKSESKRNCRIER